MKKRLNIRISRSVIPNLFTVLNIFAGFMCLTFSVQGLFHVAAWYIVLSAICDTLDGFMARLTHSASEFGVELDSLADVVSFGVAPSFLVYMMALHDYGPAGILISAIPLIFGALRLARFNVQLVGFSKEYFVGLPIPMGALMIVAYEFTFTAAAITRNANLHAGLAAVVLCCGLLMVSTIRYPVFPKLSPLAVKRVSLPFALGLLGGLVVVFSKGRLVFPVLSLFVLSGIAGSIIRFFRRLPSRSASDGDDAAHDEGHDPLPLDTR